MRSSPSTTHHSKALPVEQVTEALSAVPLNDSLTPGQVAEVEHVLRGGWWVSFYSGNNNMNSNNNKYNLKNKNK